jgi:diguanylate cyclase (GGDEF)-like protein
MATTDGLTQVANRKAIMDHLDRVMHRAQGSKESIAVTLADIDHFKRFNDTYGHQCGDEVLVQFAKRLEKACRPEDRVGRYGGEEFIVVSSGVPPASAFGFGQRLLHAVNGTPFQTQSGALPVTASFGLVCTVCGQSATSTSLTRAADALLYEAKARGRNQVVTSVD